MSATDAARASTGTAPAGVRGQRGVALKRDQISVATVLFVDVRVRSLLMGETRKCVVTSGSGIPRGDQSFLVRMILTGAVATLLRDLAPRPWPARPAPTLPLGALPSATLRGIAGAPSRNMPIAAALIALPRLASAPQSPDQPARSTPHSSLPARTGSDCAAAITAQPSCHAPPRRCLRPPPRRARRRDAPTRHGHPACRT